MEPDRDGHPAECARCYHCARERIADGRWILMGTHCRKCGAAIWRQARHGLYGHVVYLWPDPTHVTAQHFVFGAGPAMQPYCAGCAPRMGEDSPHQAECGGEPVTLGPVVGYLDTPTRYAQAYSPAYGRFLPVWLRDTLALDDETADALVNLWHADRDSIITLEIRGAQEGAPLSEPDHGRPHADDA